MKLLHKMTLEEKFAEAEKISPAWDRVTLFSWSDLTGMRDRILALERAPSPVPAPDPVREKLIEALKAIDDSWSREGWTPENAKARTCFSDDTIAMWKQIRAALALAAGKEKA